MTREERIEAAARVLEEFDLFALESFGEWDVAAKALLRAAFPELMSDPPTGWVAPMEATEAMTLAFIASELSLCAKHDSYENSARTGFIAMRDAYTKEQT